MNYNNKIQNKNQEKNQFFSSSIKKRYEIGMDIISKENMLYFPLVFAKASLPVRNTNQKTTFYSRSNGYYKLIMEAPANIGIPSGILLRKFFILLATEIVKTKSPFIDLGNNYKELLQRLGCADNSSQARESLKKMLLCLYYTKFSITKTSVMAF